MIVKEILKQGIFQATCDSVAHALGIPRTRLGSYRKVYSEALSQVDLTTVYPVKKFRNRLPAEGVRVLALLKGVEVAEIHGWNRLTIKKTALNMRCSKQYLYKVFQGSDFHREVAEMAVKLGKKRIALSALVCGVQFACPKEYTDVL